MSLRSTMTGKRKFEELGDRPGNSKKMLIQSSRDDTEYVVCTSCNKPYLVQDTSGGMCMACIDEDMDKAMIAQYAALGVELKIIDE